MKHPDAREIIELTRKLEKQDDITLKEADRIFSLLSKSSLNTKLNYYSSRANNFLINAVGEWFQVVAEKIKQGKRGNFIFTIAISNIPVDNSGGFYDFARVALNDAKETLEKYGCAEDLFTELLMDSKIYNTIPEEFQKLFTKKYVDSRFNSIPEEFQKLFTKKYVDSRFNSFYILKNPRAGMLNYPIKTNAGAYTLSQLIAEKFSPVMEKRGRTTGEILFEVASGALEIFPHSRFLKEITGTMAAKCVVVSYMKYKDIPCMTITGCKDKDGEFSVFFTEKDKAQIIKDVLKIPFEDIVKNALDEDVIDKQIAKDLLNCKLISDFPAESFMKTSVEFVDKRLQMQKERKATEKAVEEEAEWLMEIR